MRAPTSATGIASTRQGHWLHLRDPAVKSLVDELLPGQMVPIARRARIFSHGVLTRYPYQANLHGLPPEVIKECLLGVVEAKLGHATRRPPARVTSRTTACALRRRDLEALHDPVQREDLGRAPARDHGGLVFALRAAAQPGPGDRGRGRRGPPEMGYNQSFLYPKSGGIETFTRALLTAWRPTAFTRGPAPTRSTGSAAR
jgi:hypothetical protein